MHHHIILPLAVGRGGMGKKWREGDGITPLGRWCIDHVLFRADRVAAPATALPLYPIAPPDIWVDDPAAAHYNQPLTRGGASMVGRAVRHNGVINFSHEQLWRADDVYNLVAVLDYNLRPVVAGRGSAIFIHLARPLAAGGFAPTEGCLALAEHDLRHLLAQVGRDGAIEITSDGVWVENR